MHNQLSRIRGYVILSLFFSCVLFSSFSPYILKINSFENKQRSARPFGTTADYIDRLISRRCQLFLVITLRYHKISPQA